MMPTVEFWTTSPGNFMGTDTIAGIEYARRYYKEEMAGFSIPASEHSTITSWGRDHEADAYENMLSAYPEGLVACVSDSYDIYRACESIWGSSLKDKVLGRKGTLVVRPDSGDPPVVCGQVLDVLGKAFGYSVNAKGYKGDIYTADLGGDELVEVFRNGKILVEPRFSEVRERAKV